MRPKISFIPFLLLLSSCATFWNGNLSSNLAITPDQYKVIAIARGEAKTFLFLGIFGGKLHQNLVLEAKKNLIQSYPLDSNMVYANWSVSFKNDWNIFGLSQICEVQSEIVGLKPGVNYKEKPFIIKTRSIKPVKIGPTGGDSVVFNHKGVERKGLVIKHSATTMKVLFEENGKNTIINIFNRDAAIIRPKVK